MLTLDLPVEPYWLTLPRGVRVEIRPVTTAVMAAAQAASARKLGALRAAEPELDPDMARGLAFALGFAFSSAFEDAIVRGARLSEVLKGLLQDMTRIIARRTITEPLGNAASAGLSSIGAGNWLNDIGTAIGGLFRADGGPVSAGQPYIVGERGPEWFVPNQAGTVLPNGTAPAGTTINTSIAIDARGADAGVEARLRILAGQIARQSSSMTLDAIRRGGSAYETVRG
jgi:hypothetical protein